MKKKSIPTCITYAHIYLIKYIYILRIQHAKFEKKEFITNTYKYICIYMKRELENKEI